MIDLEALLVQILLLGVFGVVYAWIGGKIGFKSGFKSGKKEIFKLFEINPKEWEKLPPSERRAKLTQLLGSLLQDVLKQAAATPTPNTNEDTEKEEDDPILPNPENYKKNTG